MSRLKSSILRCRQAAESAGYAAPAPDKAQSQRELAELEALVHPRGLPEDLRTLVGHWDANCAANYQLFPNLSCHPSFAASVVEDDAWPRALIPIAYQSHCFLLMELDFEGSTGPAIYTFEWSGDGIQLIARSLDVVFEWAAEQFVALSAGLLPEGIPEINHGLRRPVTGPEREVFDYYQISTWPTRWQHQQGVSQEMYQLKGATHTVADFEMARRKGEVVATLVGEVRNLGGSRNGSLLRLTDQTGAVEVFEPSTVPQLEATPSGRYEIDVVAAPLRGPETRMDQLRPDHAEVERRALSGDVRGAADAATPLHQHLLGKHPVVATARRAVPI